MSDVDLKILLRAEDQATAEVNKALASIRKSEVQYERDSAALSREVAESRMDSRQREVYAAQLAGDKMMGRYQDDGRMQEEIARATAAKIEGIEREQDAKEAERFQTKRGLMGMVGGFAVVEAFNIGLREAALIMDEDRLAASAATGDLEVMLRAEDKVLKDTDSLLASIPLIGGGIKMALDTFSDRHWVDDALAGLKEIRQATESLHKDALKWEQEAERETLIAGGASKSEIMAADIEKARKGRYDEGRTRQLEGGDAQTKLKVVQEQLQLSVMQAMGTVEAVVRGVRGPSDVTADWIEKHREEIAGDSLTAEKLAAYDAQRKEVARLEAEEARAAAADRKVRAAEDARLARARLDDVRKQNEEESKLQDAMRRGDEEAVKKALADQERAERERLAMIERNGREEVRLREQVAREVHEAEMRTAREAEQTIRREATMAENFYRAMGMPREEQVQRMRDRLMEEGAAINAQWYGLKPEERTEAKRQEMRAGWLIMQKEEQMEEKMLGRRGYEGPGETRSHESWGGLIRPTGGGGPSEETIELRTLRGELGQLLTRAVKEGLSNLQIWDGT